MSIIPITGTYRSEPAMESRAEGRAEGITKSVLRVLDHRGISVSTAAQTRIAACNDPALAETRLDEALDVTSADELTGLAEA